MMNEPPWMIEARVWLGQREIPGVQTAGFIKTWLRELGAWWSDDETPWCGTFVAHCLRATSYDLPKNWFRARAWLDWGTVLSHPCVGCVAVFERDGGGHVAFVVGIDNTGYRLAVLGGNQGNEVSIAFMPRERVLGYRWPLGAALILNEPQVLAVKLSESEA